MHIKKSNLHINNPDWEKLLYVAEIRPTAAAAQSLSSKDKVAKEELIACARTASRTKKETDFEWLIGRLHTVTETSEEYTVNVEFNSEQHSWDYSWKSNRWIVDETHCFDIIIFKPDAASPQVVNLLKSVASKPFTIFSARHIKKNNNGAGLSIESTMTYAAATTAAKNADPMFVKRRADSEKKSAKISTPKSASKSPRSSSMINHEATESSTYAKPYPAIRQSTHRLTEKALSMIPSKYGASNISDESSSESSSDFDYAQSPSRKLEKSNVDDESASTAAQALAFAVSAAVAELGGEQTKKRRLIADDNGNETISIQGSVQKACRGVGSCFVDNANTTEPLSPSVEPQQADALLLMNCALATPSKEANGEVFIEI